MSRRMWVVVFGGALAIGAVIAGSIIATGQDSDGTRTPTGAETRMRLEAVNSEVSCGSIAAVRIYLDDLVPRESGRTPGVSAGVVGFQATLQYDPTVLRILGGSDVQLNADLGQQDVDGDGVVRSFLPSLFLEDHLGRAVVGGISFVPSSQGLEDNLEEGIDPVAKGESLLLMTVRFTPVGQGTTTVRNAGWDGPLASVEPQVFDTNGDFYEPLKVEDTQITVRGGDCLPPPPSPTTQPTSTPFVVPTRTPVRWETVEPVDAPSAGRTDCPQSWVAYADLQDRYSICYPADFDATASDAAVNVGTRSGETTEDGVSVSFALIWNARPSTIYHPPNEENCSHESVLGTTLSTGVVDAQIGAMTFPLCFTQGILEASTTRLGTLNGAIPVASGGSDAAGFVHVHVGFAGDQPDQVPDIVLGVLGTLLVGQG